MDQTWRYQDRIEASFELIYSAGRLKEFLKSEAISDERTSCYLIDQGKLDSEIKAFLEVLEAHMQLHKKGMHPQQKEAMDAVIKKINDK